MKRLLCTSTRNRCPFGCTYCFSRFSQYKSDRLPSIEDVTADSGMNGILYPACDYDLFAVKNPLEILEPLLPCRSCLSVSTKASLSRTDIRDIGQIADTLRESKRVFRIGISVTSRTRLDRDEPGTASYEERIESAERLQKTHAKVVLVLKPLLASVSVGEYKAIVNDFREHIDAVLFGMEYLDEEKPRIPQKGLPRRKRVGWLPGQPLWPYSDLTHYVHALETHCRRIDAPCFTSDRDLMETLANHAGSRQAKGREHGRHA